MKIFGLLNFFGCLLLCYTHNLQGLPSGSKVFSETQAVSIEQLTAGDFVTSYISENNSYPNITVQQISKIDVNTIVEIKTAIGSIVASSEQPFYDDAKHDFVPARALTDQSVLISRSLGKISCSGITLHSIKTTCYKLALSWPHIFFTTDLEVLVHNAAPAMLLLPALIETFAGVAIIASAYVNGKIEIFSNLSLGRSQAFKNIELFSAPYRNQLPTNTKLNTPYASQPPIIAGIKPHPNMYNHMVQYPQLYSPMIVTAEMNVCGDVICMLWSIHLDSCDGKTNWYSKTAIGKETLARSNPIVKVFIQEEDKKQLDQLRDFIKTWPAQELARLKAEADSQSRKFSIGMDYTQTPSKSFDHHPSTPVYRKGVQEPNSLLQFSDKMIYGLKFTGHAIQRMVERGIPPSVVANAIDRAKKGTKGIEEVLVTVDPVRVNRFKLDDKLNKIRIVIESNWHTVVSVFSNSDIGKK